MYIYIVCDTCPRKKKKRKKKKEEERGKWEGKRAIRMNNTSGEENTARKGTVGLGKGLRYGTKKKRKKNGWERRRRVMRTKGLEIDGWKGIELTACI